MPSRFQASTHEVMNTMQDLWNWKDFHDTLNCLSRWFSVRARCDRFIAECVMKNDRIQDSVAGYCVLSLVGRSVPSRRSLPVCFPPRAQPSSQHDGVTCSSSVTDRNTLGLPPKVRSASVDYPATSSPHILEP